MTFLMRITATNTCTNAYPGIQLYRSHFKTLQLTNPSKWYALTRLKKNKVYGCSKCRTNISPEVIVSQRGQSQFSLSHTFYIPILPLSSERWWQHYSERSPSLSLPPPKLLSLTSSLSSASFPWCSVGVRRR